ncbi:hypothetical protein ACN469_15975 [Corallococcus terminator]
MNGLWMCLLTRIVPLLIVGLSGVSGAAEWIGCGRVDQLVACQLPNYPSTRYEYGMAVYNDTPEPQPVACLGWNIGWRIHNKEPHFIHSDNPTIGTKWGGFMFYMGTSATDDDTCLAGTWRQRYWHLDANNSIVTGWSNGCFNQVIYCRAR